MKRYLLVLLLVFLAACESRNEGTSTVSTSAVESKQIINPETKTDNQIATIIPEELLGDWKVNNKGFGLEVLDGKAVFYIGGSKVVSKDYYMDEDNPVLIYIRFFFEYVGVKYDQISIGKTGYSEYFNKSEGIDDVF